MNHAMTRLLIALTLTFTGNHTMASEQPAYEVVQRHEDYELRRYQPYLVAETRVTGDFATVGNQAFRILAGYISGNNRGKEKIEMTAPVNQSPVPAGERIAMTAPVSQTSIGNPGDGYLFSFMIPSHYTLENLPRPNDPRIELRRIEGRLMAARTYSGSWSEQRYQLNQTALMRALAAAGLQPLGASVFARYNSPFTIWFLRRNEVLVEIKTDNFAQPGT